MAVMLARFLRLAGYNSIKMRGETKQQERILEEMIRSKMEVQLNRNTKIEIQDNAQEEESNITTKNERCVVTRTIFVGLDQPDNEIIIHLPPSLKGENISLKYDGEQG